MHIWKWITRFMNNIFRDQVLPSLSPNSAIILNSASYHSHETVVEEEQTSGMDNITWRNLREIHA
jgi:hypothetical protein